MDLLGSPNALVLADFFTARSDAPKLLELSR
jgi:hypothetical protein